MIDHAARESPGTTWNQVTGVARGEFARRVAIAAGIILLAAALAATFIIAADVFFLFFLAILLAILLRSASDPLGRWLGIGPGWSLALVILFVALLFAGGAYSLGSVIVGQIERFSSDFPRSIDHARTWLEQRPWGRQLLHNLPSSDSLMSGGMSSVASSAERFFTTTLGVLGNVLVLIFLTVYLAASPQVYVTGILLLVPPRRRDRAHEVVRAIGYHLQWWLVGRLVAVVAVGLITGIGLWLVGVPQFLILGLLAGALTIVPYIGPIVSAIPGILLALVQGPMVALWAIGVYLLAQAAENYLITPLVQQNTVNIPPVLTIISLVLIGTLFGVVGLVVATPLAVTVMVAVKMLYVEDILGQDLNVPP